VGSGPFSNLVCTVICTSKNIQGNSILKKR
jgi:hypothetical protein